MLSAWKFGEVVRDSLELVGILTSHAVSIWTEILMQGMNFVQISIVAFSFWLQDRAGQVC